MRSPSTIFLLLFFAGITLSRAQTTKTCRAVQTCRSLPVSKTCSLLPVPRRERRLISPPSGRGFILEKLRPGIFAYSDLAYRTLIIYRAKRLVLVDFPNSASSFTPTGNYLLITAVGDILDRNKNAPRRVDMIYSHRHTDHIGRAGLVKDYLQNRFKGINIAVWSTALVREFLKARNITRIPTPTRLVGPSGRIIKISRRFSIRLSIVGGHTGDDLAIHIPPSSAGPGIIHFVDVITPGRPPFIDFGLTMDFFGTIEAQRTILKLNWEILSGGHGRLGRKFNVRQNIRYMQSVLQAAAQSLREGDTRRLGRIGRLVSDRSRVQFGNGAWSAVATLDIFIEICVRKTIVAWGCKLAGVDVLAPSHCKEALFVLTSEL